VVLVVAGAATAWIVLPVLPPATLVAGLHAIGFKPPAGERMEYRELPQHLADQFGWPELARTVSRAYLALPEAERRDAVVVARNYGEAGALDFYARELPLPRVISPHNNYWLWGPGPVARPAAMLVVGEQVADVAKSCAEATQVATTPPDPFVLPYEDELPIVL